MTRRANSAGPNMLILVDKKFGAELTVTDLTGKKPRQRGMHRTESASTLFGSDVTGRGLRSFTFWLN
jgi:hypothetical protein